MQGDPPQHHRFNDPRIPSHITYAYKQNAKIIKNDDFYVFPEGQQSKEIDLLFLMANAPVGTLSSPESGSQSYSGLALNMQLSMESLSTQFPNFFQHNVSALNTIHV